MFYKYAQYNKLYYNKQNKLTAKRKIQFNCRDECLNKSIAYCSARMSFMESSSTTFSWKLCIVKLTLWVHINRQQLWLLICHKTRFRLVYNNKQARKCTPVLLHNITSSESLAAGCTKKNRMEYIAKCFMWQ